MMNRTRVSAPDAQRILDDLPTPVHPKLSWNAANPRMLMGLAASLSISPKVIVYSTEGMDPRGVELLHDYLDQRRSGLFGVYISSIPGDDGPSYYPCITIGEPVSPV